MYRIFLVEDDFDLAQEIKKQLETYGHEVVVADDFQNVMTAFSEVAPAMVLLDIKLPFYTGFHWCEAIRKVSSVPIVFISSVTDNMNIVTAMNMGGDDFIRKPVDPMVLNAKVQAILRRTYEMKGNIQVLDFSGALLNLSEGVIHYNGERIELTKNELRILQTLLENKGKVISREDLMMALWESDLYVEDNTLTVNVGRLRKKLEAHGMKDAIITKPGRGYMICDA